MARECREPLLWGECDPATISFWPAACGWVVPLQMLETKWCTCCTAAVPQDYDAFWESFGRFVKLGCIEDGVGAQPRQPPHGCCSSIKGTCRFALPLRKLLCTAGLHPQPDPDSLLLLHPPLLAQDNRKALAPLLRFPSSGVAAEEGLTSLADYVARKKEGQTQIYYLAGEPPACYPLPVLVACCCSPCMLVFLQCSPSFQSFARLFEVPPLLRSPDRAADSRAAAEASPYVESLTRRGYEVSAPPAAARCKEPLRCAPRALALHK